MKTFTIDNFNINYPYYILNKEGTKYYNFKKAVLYSSYSRTYQLSHRSTQSIQFDLLIDVGYFNLLGINETILKEFVLINTDLDNDKTRSYYLLDYFIPSKSLCIELDSSFHEEVKDSLKDKFLHSLGIKVLRIRDFNIETKDKLEVIINFIKSNPLKEFRIDYSNLIRKYIEDKRTNIINSARNYYSKNIDLLTDVSEITNLMYRSLRMIGITEKKAKKISKISSLDKNIFLSILYNSRYNTCVELDELYEVLPMLRKSSERYWSITKYLSSLGINLEIKTSRRKLT